MRVRHGSGGGEDPSEVELLLNDHGFTPELRSVVPRPGQPPAPIRRSLQDRGRAGAAPGEMITGRNSG
jgi:hypothetical protein